MQKRIAAIHDISGIGRCSLTVVLPILSAAGVECACVPTAVLSTHTGEFKGFTYRDLNDDLRPMLEHWKTLGLKFDAIYSGFLGSVGQVDIIKEYFDSLGDENTIKLVDPVMADNGKLYKTFGSDMVEGMIELCKKADIIIPNITEACLISGVRYADGFHDENYIKEIIDKLCVKLGNPSIVLTGVNFASESFGAAAYNAKKNTLFYHMNERIEGGYYGTGDIFASVVLSGILNEKSLDYSVQLAVDFTIGCIKRCNLYGIPPRQGVPFEQELPKLIKWLDLDC